MLGKLFRYVEKYKKYMILAIFCIVTETIFELIIPLIMADIIDVGVANADRIYILQKGILMVICALISLVLGTGSAKFSAICGQGMGAELRKAAIIRN